jgi:beta-N-acetylhexosaminidase
MKREGAALGIGFTIHYSKNRGLLDPLRHLICGAMKRRGAEPTLREKAGQMLLVGFRGCEISDADPIARDLAEGNIGGVILFDEEMADGSRGARNIQSPEQVKALVAALQRRARTPLLVAIDQEGGQVNRLKPRYGFPATLSHEELGASNDLGQTYAQAREIAATLADLGINLNLAPVVDLGVCDENPIIKGKRRSFSADPQIVARHAVEFCRAHRERGVLTCPKHFPGHGSARGDTHKGWVDVTPHWTEQELFPFQRLIESGLCDMIMTAHVFNAMLDPHRPATLSQPVLQHTLRRNLGFDGVIVSDDMEMKAIDDEYGLAAIPLGIEAGLDLLLFGNNMKYDPEIGRKACDIICQLVETGKITEARVDESYQRLQRVKRKLKSA